MALRIQESGYFSLAAAALRDGRGLHYIQELRRWRQQGDGSFFGLPWLRSEVEKSLQWSQLIGNRANQLVVFGIGGSSLGGEMLVRASVGGGLPVRFFDNVDPDLLAELATVDWRETFLLVVSKSGSTAETLAQFLTVLPMLESCCGGELAQRVAVVTQAADSPLGVIAQRSNIPIIAHPPVGGRFAVLSVVGLLPMAVAGGQVEALLAGAMVMGERCLRQDPLENPALAMAMARQQLLMKGQDISVSMAYGGRLADVPAWMAQLEAESLGKRRGDGKALGVTPMTARGVTDQHALLQLFLDGPANKHYTFYYDPSLAHRGEVIPHWGVPPVAEVGVLAGRRTGQLFEAEFFGTRDALLANGSSVRTLEIATGDAGALGEAIVLLETEVAILGIALGIDPFDQPAVEAGKVRARHYLEKVATS